MDFPFVVVDDSRPQAFGEANVTAMRIFSTLKLPPPVSAGVTNSLYSPRARRLAFLRAWSLADDQPT
jgi:hypothetical protein